HAAVNRPITTANIPNTAPAATAAAPRAMLDAFCVISALASSSSSRTRAVMRSETSATAVAMFSGCPFLSGKAFQQHREHDPACKRGAHGDLGVVVGPGCDLSTGVRLERGLRLRLRLRDTGLFGHSGGSSSKI